MPTENFICQEPEIGLLAVDGGWFTQFLLKQRVRTGWGVIILRFYHFYLNPTYIMHYMCALVLV